MILVFKTNVSDSSDEQILQPLLNKHLPNMAWSFDLEDCDRILRIDSNAEVTETIIRLMQNSGFECEELTDN